METLTASIEPISGTLRIHSEDIISPWDWRHQYTNCCTIRFLFANEVVLSGLTFTITPSIWKAMNKLLWDLGIANASWERYKADGTHRIVRITIKDPNVKN